MVFKPKVNMALFKKMLRFGRHVEQTDAIQMYYGRGFGGKPPSRWKIFAISGIKITTLTSFGSDFERFKATGKTKLLILRIYA